MAEWKPFDLTWGRSIYYCTECEESTEVPTVMGKPIYKYCPMCGAKMNADRKTEPTISKMEQVEGEPTWEQVKEYCNKRCLDIVDSALRKQWYKDEPQTENGIGCSRCEGRYDCYDRDMPNAVHCNNYGKVTDEPQTEQVGVPFGEMDEATFKSHCLNCQRDTADIKCLDCDGNKYFLPYGSKTDCAWK